MKEIINAHVHLGEDVVFDESCDEAELLTSEKYGVSRSIVQPFICRPYIEDTRAAHDRIAALCAAHPGRFYGMASVNPHFRPQDYAEEVTRCVKQLGFVGVKITPVAHAADPQSRDVAFACEVARSLNVPMMIHTGSGVPFSDPFRLLRLAQSFPQLTFVVAHAGTDMFFSQALYLAQECENVFLEPSWLSILCLRTALKKLGAAKVMFSSDHVVNIPVELAKYNTLLENDPASLAQALGGTARAVFRLGEGKA